MISVQRTIGKSVTISGHGLHTGVKVDVVIHPAPENHGVVFRRIDLEGEPTVKAHVDYVVDTSRSTTIEHNKARVGTIEHALSALAGLEICNVLIDINAPEMPILDGSARQYVDAIKAVGVVNQKAEKEISSNLQNLRDSGKDFDDNELMAVAKEFGNEKFFLPFDKAYDILTMRKAGKESAKSAEKRKASSLTGQGKSGDSLSTENVFGSIKRGSWRDR